MTRRDLLSNFFTLDFKRVDWTRTVLLVLLILASFAALWQWAMPQVREVQITQYRRVPEIREVAKVRRILVPCPERGIVALDRDQVNDQLGPGWERNTPVDHHFDGSHVSDLTHPSDMSDGSHVSDVSDPTPPPDRWPVATAEVRETTRTTDVIAVYNSTTGVTDLVAKEKSAPWLQLRSDWVAGLRYGIDHRLDQTATLYGSWTFLRVRDLYLSGYTELATDIRARPGDDLRWKGQVDLQYRH